MSFGIITYNYYNRYLSWDSLKLLRGNQTSEPAQLKVIISYAVFQRLSKLRPNKRNKTKNQIRINTMQSAMNVRQGKGYARQSKAKKCLTFSTPFIKDDENISCR